MKGIMIYETPLWGDEEKTVYTQELTEASYTLKQIGSDDAITCHLEGTATKDPVTKAKCSQDDTYDFETGALIALMKKCGLEKSAKAYAEIFDDTAYGDALIERDKLKEENERLKEKNAELLGANGYLRFDRTCNESTIDSLENTRDLLINNNNKLIEENKRLKAEKDLSWKNYQRKIQKKQDRINELEAQITASEDDKQKTIEYYEKEIERLNNVSIASLKEKIEKLKLDCEKLQHGYVDIDNVPSGHWDGDILDIVFLPGRACGKQYKALVEMFKKIDQKKVDAAYKEAYGSRVIWCSSQSSTRDMLDSLLDSCKYAIVSDKDGEKIEKWTGLSEFSWEIKILTKREEMWERILEIHKKSNVVIVVEKEDVDAFLHEIENRIPEIRWASWQKIFEAKGTIKDMYEALKTCDRIYFRLWKENKLSYSSDPDIYQYKDLEHISYLPPMRWDLFRKGRIAVKVNYDNYKEFYEACEKELGKKPSAMFCGDFTVSICKKDGFFEIFTIEDQKKTGRKIVDWEDVR